MSGPGPRRRRPRHRRPAPGASCSRGCAGCELSAPWDGAPCGQLANLVLSCVCLCSQAGADREQLPAGACAAALGSRSNVGLPRRPVLTVHAPVLVSQLRKSEIEYYCMLAKVMVVPYNGNNIDMGTAVGKFYRVSAMTIIDAGAPSHSSLPLLFLSLSASARCGGQRSGRPGMRRSWRGWRAAGRRRQGGGDRGLGCLGC